MKRNKRLNLELFIARRIHFNKEEGEKATPPAVRIAMAGIALGLAVMILSVAIVVGFKKEVRNKVIGFGSHIQITNLDTNSSFESSPIAVSDTLLGELRALPGIGRAEVFATKAGMLKTDDSFQGVLIKGVDAEYDWTFFAENLKEGRLPEVGTERASTEVILSRRLADQMRLKVDETVLAYFVQEEVRARRFVVTGIYETGYGEYDKLFVIGDIRQIRRLNNWDEDQAGGIELLVDDYNRLDERAEELFYFLGNRQDRTGNFYFSRSIKELNPMIFGWLGALDTNVVVILLLMMAVAGFTMISGLLIIILERINMIGILKSMGQSSRSIRKIFLYISFFLIGRGMLWGNAIGLAICLLQSRFRLLRLDPEVYYIDAVPIDLSVGAWVGINVGTLVVSMLMMLGPTWYITKIDPAKNIRFE